MGDFQAIIKPEFNTSSNIFVIRPMTSDDQVYSILNNYIFSLDNLGFYVCIMYDSLLSR